MMGHFDSSRYLDIVLGNKECLLETDQASEAHEKWKGNLLLLGSLRSSKQKIKLQPQTSTSQVLGPPSRIPEKMNVILVKH